MQKINDNPFLVVAAATAGGMIVGTIMKNRNLRHAHEMRGMYGRQYRQPSFVPYDDYSRNSGYGQSPYQGPSAFADGPQYRAEQEFRPQQAFQGRHENFPGGSNWD
jgi:hypothetical protein